MSAGTPRAAAPVRATERHPRSLPQSAPAAGRASTGSVVAHRFHVDTCSPRRLPSNTSLLGEVALPAIAPGRAPAPVDTGRVGRQRYIRICVLERGGHVPRTKPSEPAEALDCAMELFWRQGYAATPLDRLGPRTRTSRSSGERDLPLACLEQCISAEH